MYSLVKDWRNRRNMMYDPSHYSVDNYYTDIRKKEMKHSFGDDLLNNLHLFPDPLKKNLADSLITSDDSILRPSKDFLNLETVEDRFAEPEPPARPPEQAPMAPLSGISSFFSGVMNVLSGAMFTWRPRSPKYYDCYDDSNASRQGSPPPWHPASGEDRNKNERANGLISNVQTELKSDMNQDCKSAAAQCEDKLNKVRMLLSTKPVETPKYRSRRPRKAFVEPGSVEESFEDAFSPEDFVSLSNDPYIEYYSPCQYHQEELLQTDAPKMRTKVAPVCETTNIVEPLPVVENIDKNCTDVKSDNLNCETKQTECKSVKTVNSVNSKIENKITDSSVNVIPDNKLNVDTNSKNVPKETNNVTADENTKQELVSSCEDKLSKLKALLQERRNKNTKTIQSSNSAPELVDMTNDEVQTPSKTVPIEKSPDKRFKNPCRRTDKRKKTKLKKHIHDDMMFAHEIPSEDLSSVENSPSMNSLENYLSGRKQSPNSNSRESLSDTPVGTPNLSVTPPSLPKDPEYFDEVSGRFRSTSSTDSEDSFQIVFNDSPKARRRIPSDCDSEDSFIVFEESPDSCYTSNDVFGEESDEDSAYTDSDSEESDSGCNPVTILAHNLSRTIGDLTDTSLYEEKCVDEVDCAIRTVCEELSSEDILDVSEDVCEKNNTGLLLTEAKKLLKKGQPPKKVQFSSRPPEVRVMRVWAFAAKQARVGHWELYARDRCRFKRRIADVDMAVSWVLKPQHRSRVRFQRFMPWWNAQNRKEIAERKLKEEEEKRLAEQKEEERRLEEQMEVERLAEEKRMRAEDEGDESKVAGDDNVIENVESGITGDFIPKEEADVTAKDVLSFTDDKKESIPINSKGDGSNEKIEQGTGNMLKESGLKPTCNGVHIVESKDSEKDKVCNDVAKDLGPKLLVTKGDIGKVNGQCVNYIKEQKHNVIAIRDNDRNSKLGIVSKKNLVVANEITKDLVKKSMCKEKIVNGKVKDIKLDLKETVPGT